MSNYKNNTKKNNLKLTTEGNIYKNKPWTIRTKKLKTANLENLKTTPNHVKNKLPTMGQTTNNINKNLTIDGHTIKTRKKELPTRSQSIKSNKNKNN